MRTRTAAWTMAFGVCAGLAAGVARPAAGQDLNAALQQCRVLPDAMSRLFCYDRLVDAGAGALPPATPVRPAMPAVPATPVAPQATAPLPTVATPTVTTPRAAARDATAADPDALSARVTALAFDPYGDAVLTLDNGQRWKQTEGRTFKVDTGTVVTLKKGLLGAYFMTAEGGARTVKVKRVQ
ncbi:MAG: hypothetical protein SFV21_14710 [Rhodospirillaceae bacterium]|nr:hypothetical protein [Rhodospirillaceae bacterium]